MKSIRQYAIPMSPSFSLMLPKGAEVLHVYPYDRVGYMSVLGDDSKPMESRDFFIVRTWDPFPNANQYVFRGSFFENSSIWHLFEGK